MDEGTAEVVICGAGIAGVAAAYHLAVKGGMRGVVLVEQGAPLSLTSDKSTECYRNWWPGPGDAMVRLMNRSIDLLEAIARESDNAILLNRRGYVYATADPQRIADFRSFGEEAAALGAGPLRVHDGTAGAPAYQPTAPHAWEGQPDGADLLLDQALIREHFPYLADDVVALLHPRRCGWFSAQQLGMWMLDRAREAGVQLVRGSITGIDAVGGRVRAVQIANESGGESTIATPRFVSAAGPLQQQIGTMLGVELPLYSERHVKLAFNDHLGAVPRDAGLLIWTDPVDLPWSEDEREALSEDDEGRRLLARFPAGVHGRPEGGGASTAVLLLWTYDMTPVEPTFPLPYEDEYPEIAIRGMSRMLPALSGYFERIPKCYIDGGYYTRTRENRPLVGPLPVEGAFMIGALGGFGLMAACACGELLAAHISNSTLPSYAAAFQLDRYDNPEYQQLLAQWGETGQL